MGSTIVAKAKDKILNPDKRTTEVEGVIYKIKPLSDVMLNELGETVSKIVSVLGVVQLVFSDGFENAPLTQLASQIPGLFNIIIPASTKIIALSLKPLDPASEIVVDEEWVQENIYFNDRIRILSDILEANGISEILGELKKAATRIIPTKPESTPDLMPTLPLPKSTLVTNPTPSATS